MCPFANLQRDGKMQMSVPRGRANYEPNSIAPDGPRESLARGFRTAPIPTEGTTVRLRAESFADHYSQARLFYRSVTPQEQRHIGKALTPGEYQIFATLTMEEGAQYNPDVVRLFSDSATTIHIDEGTQATVPLSVAH